MTGGAFTHSDEGDSRTCSPPRMGTGKLLGGTGWNGRGAEWNGGHTVTKEMTCPTYAPSRRCASHMQKVRSKCMESRNPRSTRLRSCTAHRAAFTEVAGDHNFHNV